nr:4738_t:CDS:2 [Entrophospora candida]
MESEGTSLFAISPKASLLTANSLFTKDIFSSTYNNNDFNNLKQPGFTYSSDQRQFKSSLHAPSSILSSTNTNNNISSSSDMWAAPGSSNRPSSNVTHRKIIDDIIFYRPDSHIALDNLTSTFDPFKSDNTTKKNIVLDPSKNEEETNEDFRSNVTQPYNINNTVTPEILTSRFEPFKYNNIANTNVTFDPFSNDITILDHQLGNGTSNNFNRSVSANDKYLGANTRFSGVDLEDFAGQIYSLCKDQHGCRFLQKKLEENNQSYIDMIFNEVYKHFVELITVSSDLVNISLNVHGTRAVQKIIELVTENKHDYAKYIYKTQQICTLIQSLNSDVVTLIQDLNGNHVIQKCLRLFTPEENQFIYNAVSSNCLEVATHKNGCCVFQRCIDNGTKQQRILLLRTIIHHALTLSQDKYGNYVVQYAINFNNQQFTNALSRKILGHVYVLSIQQCSSNVVEALLISEIINCHHIDRLLQDSFGNYVIQTALSQAGLDQKAELIKHLQPFLTTIDNAPYGKKVQGKINCDIKFLKSLYF